MRSLAFCLLLTAVAGGCDTLDQRTEHPYVIRHTCSIADPQFERTMGSLLGPPIITGNSITTLVNGDRIFPPMLDAIRSAKKTIDFETYVWWAGEVSDAFTEALCDRARAGVKVHVMIDSFGSGKIGRRVTKRMKDAGVQIVQYHPLRWYNLTAAQKLDNRTHRKLLIIDGTIGFTGGVGIADEWTGDAQSPKHWRDNHYIVKGPVVSQLQAAFCDNWMETTGNVLQGDVYFPPVKDAGEQGAQVFQSSSSGGSQSMELMYLLSIAAAEKNIRLCSAYFIPDVLTIKALRDARERGVSVQIIVPGNHIDEKIVRRASRARWGDMLKDGVEIYEYQPTMFHTKLMIVDDRWVSIGSANLDNRSFRLNDEANLNVMDPKFAAEQIELFNRDLGRSKPISYDAWQHRPVTEKFMEGFSTIFGFFL